MPRVIEAFKQFFDDSGDPLVDGWLRFTESGTNNTDKDTFADVNEAIANANPFQLDAAGRSSSVFGTGSYRVVSFTDDAGSPGTQIQQFDPVGGTFGVGAFDSWNAESIYGTTDIVQGSDLLYYASLTNNNQGNDPTTDTTNWERIEFIRYWNQNKTYVLDDLVLDVNGDSWLSKSAVNLGNIPSSDDGTNWIYATPNRVVVPAGSILLASQVNEIQDGSTYTLPLAASVDSDQWVWVELPDQFSAFTPTVQRAGADTITDSDGTDTDVLFDLKQSSAVRFVSDGVSDWRI